MIIINNHLDNNDFDIIIKNKKNNMSNEDETEQNCENSNVELDNKENIDNNEIKENNSDDTTPDSSTLDRATLRANRRLERSAARIEKKELNKQKKYEDKIDKKRKLKGKSRKYRLAAPLGSLMIIFSLIGIVTVVVMATNGIISLNDNSAEKAAIERDIAPVVNIDPVVFDSIEQADSNMLLNATLWLTIKDNKDKTYVTNDDSFTLIPQTDIEKSHKKLYGKKAQVKHQTITSFGGSAEYVYDEAQQSYLVPPTGFIESMYPKVYDIKKVDNQYIVKVGYMMSMSNSPINTANSTDQIEPYKYMTYVLEKDENYYVVAVKDYVQE